ncbi:MAG: hypothetical protein R3E12_11165 [Candidatus Eisenbacteria bacterium]
MPDPEDQELADWLRETAVADGAARSSAPDRLHAELRAIAASYIRDERPDHTRASADRSHPQKSVSAAAGVGPPHLEEPGASDRARRAGDAADPGRSRTRPENAEAGR